jgi:hypothetical protein
MQAATKMCKSKQIEDTYVWVNPGGTRRSPAVPHVGLGELHLSVDYYDYIVRL